MKKRLLTLIFLNSLIMGYSQTSDNPWRFGLSGSIIDFYPVQSKSTDYFNRLGAPQGSKYFDDIFNISENWNISGASISADRWLTSGLSLGVLLSFNNITKINGTPDPNPLPLRYLSGDIYAKYKLFGDKFISPYVMAGWGFMSFDENNQLYQPQASAQASKMYLGGFGLDFKIAPKLSLGIQTNYKHAYELYGAKHFQHLVGINYNTGTGDSDKDGISDKKDKCPQVAGLKEFEGCPDTDGDGIPDNEDGCPEEPGTAEMNGCPDTDGDGVPDKDDLCPEVAGAADMDGCPDTDGDGFHDGVDECPDKAAPTSENGCPGKDTDGDGVPDTDDLCPEQAGTIESNGCPEVSDAVVSTMNGYGAMINFMANSDKILGKKMFDVLEKIKTLITENPGAVFMVEGYASSDGDAATNKALSVKRAESVRNALIQMGVDESRLEVVGFGVEKPIDTNETAQGRARNRRVQFRKKQ